MMSVIAVVAFVAGCTPLDVVTTLGPDAAYTASEKRSFDDVWEDNKLKLALNEALLDESASLFKDVGTVVYEGRVLLVGAVETAAMRRRAERIVRGQAGVRSVVNRIQVTDEGGVLAYARDAIVEKRIQAALLFDSDIASGNLRVRSVNLTVYLFGAASSRREARRTVAIARGVEEVRNVENLLWVRNRPTG